TYAYVTAENLSSGQCTAVIADAEAAANYNVSFAAQATFEITALPHVSDNARTNYTVTIVQTDADTATAADATLNFEVTLSSNQKDPMQNPSGLYLYISVYAGNADSHILYDVRGCPLLNIDEFGNLSVPYDFDYANLNGLYSVKVQIMTSEQSLIQLAGDGAQHECIIAHAMHTLTINYQDSTGGTVADQYTEQVIEGADYDVDSPAVEGYTCDTETVEGTMGAEDVTTTVTYTAVETDVD
ncbi:MAG: MucBP domain-containing protein, partial [Candidatus Methanomethylophilus sp.]|nr:MucBP domain-containing protein [Methanomethylophilus sp.]